MRRRSFVLMGAASFGCAFAPTRLARAGSILIDDDAATRLSMAIQGAVYLPGSAEYERLRHAFAAKVDLHPKLVVHAVSTADVVASVDFARDNHLPLAVRCGGHSYAGYNSCDGGIVIDLSGLRTLAAAGDHATMRIGGGALSGHVEQETAKLGRATALGQCPSVGIGGYLLGGGVSPLMSRHGLGCDNVSAAEIVLADGRVVTASADEHPDLFWAIRGGGGNFGVVTAFTVKLHPVSSVLGGYLVYGAKDPTALLELLRDLAAGAPDDLTLIATLTPDEKRGFAISIQACHAGDLAAGQTYLAPFLKSPMLVSNSVSVRAYLDLEQQVPFEIPPVHWENRGGFLPALDDDAIADLSKAIGSGPGIYDELSFIHLHGAVIRVARDATAFPLRSTGFAYGIASSWLSSSGPDRAKSWVDATAETLAHYGQGGYVNVMGREGDAAVRAAYADNYPRLAAIKARYDPSNLFSINQNIKPARV